MKRHLILFVAAILSMTVFACKDKEAFTIAGTVKNPGSLRTVYLLNVSGSAIDSATLSDEHQFQFKEHSPYANFFKLRLGGTIFDLIAKNGDEITFDTDLEDKKNTYQIKGSDESEKMREFNKLSNVYIEKTTKIASEYESKAEALGKESPELIAQYKPIYVSIINDYNKAAMKFANDNKQSLAGFYAANQVDSIKYESQLVAYADSIKSYFKDNPMVQQFVQSKKSLEPVTIGHKAPDFTIAGVDGKPIKLSDFRGKYVMLDFWASWCVPCRRENPNVVKMYAKYHPLGLNILGISLDQDKGKWQQAVQADKLTWNHGSDLKNFEGPTESLYHIYQIPTNFIIDPQGVIVAKNIMGDDLEEFLNKTFNKSQQIVKIK
ncbi:MAG TPA: redoxin domain-containing protein [Mucilaginibacter sp.]|nr:redoxin domain-containing protein [Mucilaginibacter sp.]